MIDFSASKLEKSKDFSNSELPCLNQVDIKEVLEFERDDVKVFRVTAIRDNEELL